jgi:hypothetical protein
MKPVFQEIIEPGSGDCFSACLASILEMPLSDIPKFKQLHGADMMKHVRLWAAEKFDLSVITIQMENRESDFSGADMRIVGAFGGTPCIAGGVSPNFENCNHAVVGQLDEHGLNFQMTHDPNPSGKGIKGHPTHLYFLVPLFPEKLWKL